MGADWCSGTFSHPRAPDFTVYPIHTLIPRLITSAPVHGGDGARIEFRLSHQTNHSFTSDRQSFGMKSRFVRRIKQAWRRVREFRGTLKLRLAERLFDKPRGGNRFDPGTTKSIALFQWDDKLGDTVMATRFCDAVKSARPDIDITFITGPSGETMLGNFAGIDHIEVCSRRNWVTARRLGRIGRDFDVVVDLTSSMSAIRLFALKQLNAYHYMGYRMNHYSIFDVPVADEARHFADRYVAAAEAIVGPVSTPAFFLPASEPANAAVARYLDEIPPGRKRILINLSAAGKHRNFAIDEAESMLRWWLEIRPDCYLMLLSVPGKNADLDELALRIGSVDVSSTPTPPSIDLTVALARAADLIFSPDTATVHIAAALERPLIAIFTDNERNLAEWRPRYPNARVVLTRPFQNRYDEVGVNAFSRDDLRQAIDDLLPAPVV